MDAQELGAVGQGLGFQAGEQGLEPFEGGSVLADPDEFYAAEPGRAVGPRAQVPDVLEDRGPGRDADARADQHGDFVVEDVFGGRAVGPVDAQGGHLLPVLQRDLVHAHRVEGVEVLGLGRAGAESVAQGPREVAHLPHVHADVRVEGAGGDGEGVPLRGGHRGDVEHQPLARFVFHAGLGELDLDRVVGVADHFGDLGRPPRVDLAVDALDEVDAAAPELPAPAFVTDAMLPEIVAGERRERRFGVSDEAAGRVRVEPEEEGDEEVVRVPERFEGLLADLCVGGGVHQQHAKEHDMPGDPADLGVVDLHGGFGSELGALDVEEVDIMRADVDDGEDEDRVGHLAMEPDIFIQR